MWLCSSHQVIVGAGSPSIWHSNTASFPMPATMLFKNCWNFGEAMPIQSSNYVHSIMPVCKSNRANKCSRKIFSIIDSVMTVMTTNKKIERKRAHRNKQTNRQTNNNAVYIVTFCCTDDGRLCSFLYNFGNRRFFSAFFRLRFYRTKLYLNYQLYIMLMRCCGGD